MGCADKQWTGLSPDKLTATRIPSNAVSTTRPHRQVSVICPISELLCWTDDIVRELCIVSQELN